MKNKTTALILSIFVGELGIDRFYLGYTGIGLFKLFTLGCFGIMWLIDVINIATGNLLPADGSPYSDDIQSTSARVVPQSNTFEDMERIAKLHEQGILSDEEYSKMKKTLLERM